MFFLPKVCKENEKYTEIITPKAKDKWSFFKKKEKKEEPKKFDADKLKQFEVCVDIGDIFSC